MDLMLLLKELFGFFLTFSILFPIRLFFQFGLQVFVIFQLNHRFYSLKLPCNSVTAVLINWIQDLFLLF